MLKLFTIRIDYKKGDFSMPYFYVFFTITNELIMGRKFCRWKITRRSCIADDIDKFKMDDCDCLFITDGMV